MARGYPMSTRAEVSGSIHPRRESETPHLSRQQRAEHCRRGDAQPAQPHRGQRRHPRSERRVHRNQGDCRPSVSKPGCRCYAGRWSSQDMRGVKRKAHRPHKISSAFGRREASWFQHFWINPHKSSDKSGWVGRGGRPPSLIADTAARGGLSLNGAAPVKTFIKINNNRPLLDLGRLLATNLDRNSCKREDICFLAACLSTVYDLGRNPSYAIIVFGGTAPCRMDGGKTKICDPCMAGRVHKDT